VVRAVRNLKQFRDRGLSSVPPVSAAGPVSVEIEGAVAVFTPKTAAGPER